MSVIDILIHKGEYSLELWQTDAGDTDITPGKPLVQKAAGSPYAALAANGDPVIGTTTRVLGFSASNSTHTASADGLVAVYVPLPETVWEIAPTTLTNVDTQAEIDALVGDNVGFDLSAGTYTLDENQGNGATNGLEIIGGDAARGKMYFKIRPAALEGPVA